MLGKMFFPFYQNPNVSLYQTGIDFNFYLNHNILRIGLPARSPIEHVWDIIGQRFRPCTPPTHLSLATAFQDGWRQIIHKQSSRVIQTEVHVYKMLCIPRQPASSSNHPQQETKTHRREKMNIEKLN